MGDAAQEVDVVDGQAEALALPEPETRPALASARYWAGSAALTAFPPRPATGSPCGLPVIVAALGPDR